MSVFRPAEVLEARTFLSANPANLSLNAAVRSDQIQIRADLLKFKSDALSKFATLLKDVAAIRTDDLKSATTVTPLVAKFRADIKAMWTQLKADRLTERQNVLADESVIVGDLKKILLDRGNTTAEKADHAQLRTDRI